MKPVTASLLIAIGATGANAYQARRARVAAAMAVTAAQDSKEAQAKSEKIIADAQAKSEKIIADAQAESKKRAAAEGVRTAAQRATQTRWLFVVSGIAGSVVFLAAVWATMNTTGLAERFFGEDQKFAGYVPWVLWAQVAGLVLCCVIIWSRRATADSTRWNNMLITMWTLTWSIVVVFGIAAGASGNPPEWLGSVLVTLLSINLPLTFLLILAAPKESPQPPGPAAPSVTTQPPPQGVAQ